MTDIAKLPAYDLLALYARIIKELRSRGFTRSANSPVGDLAEYLFCRAFNWEQAENSKANFDAVDSQDNRYQIKARRLTHHNTSRQLSAIRDLDGNHFDMLAGVLFRENFGVLRAALVPRAVVVDCAKFQQRTNSHRFLLRDDIWDMQGVRDVTEELRAVDLR